MTPYELKTIAVDKAVLNITFCPKSRQARLLWVLSAASSYSEHIEEVLNILNIFNKINL
jgi:hypothetical protein